MTYVYSPVERFWDNVKFEECWQWLALKSPEGYGRFFAGRKRGRLLAHRFAYEIERGGIPEGYELHHVCGNPACVNPAHLKPVTSEEHKGLHKVRS